MNLAAGARLGPYEVVAPLGAGGMGEVYRARDTRLDRTVALKVLPADVSADSDRHERFRREARAISRLSHPHICTLHDVGEQDGADFLVMEYLSGETLAHRLLRGALPLDDVLRFGIELTGALDAAHREGVTHRDLKPANIMLTPGGAKILDFGLAKWTHPAATPEPGLAATDPSLTQSGIVVGTVPYMAPEQAEGKPADARSDLFALGAVLYEMTTGQRAFPGTSPSSILAAILTSTPPPMRERQALTPPAFERTVKKCLAKDPARRWQTAADLKDQLTWIETDSSTNAAPDTSPSVPLRSRPLRRVMAAVGIGLGMTAAAAGAFVAAQRTGARAAALNAPSAPFFRSLTFRRGWIQTARFAPDGQTIVYSAGWDGKPFEIFATRRDSSEARSLGLPSGAIQSISSSGEMAIILNCREAPSCEDGVLARAPLAGGPPRELLEHVTYADWAHDGQNLAVIHTVEGRSRLEYPIGHVFYEAQVSALLEHVRFSRSGSQIAFTELSGDGLRTLFVSDLEGHRRQVLPPFGNLFDGPEWSPDDHELWYNRSTNENPSALYGTTLDGKERLIERIPEAFILRDVSADGRVLVNISAEPRWSRLIARAPGDPEDRDLSVLSNPHGEDLSNDGRTVLFDDNAYNVYGGVRGIYVRRTDGSPAVRLGDGVALGLSPDGKSVISSPEGHQCRPALLPTGPGVARSFDIGFEDCRWALWLPDGKRFILNAHETGHSWRGYLLDVDGTPPRPITAEGVEPVLVSPDGRLVLASGPDRSRSAVLLPIEGGASRPVRGLDPDDAPVQWSSDPQFLFVRTPGMFPAHVVRFDIETGAKTPWKDLAPADRAGLFWVGRMDTGKNLFITPDGRGYAYRYIRVLSDLFLVDGLR